MSGKKTTSAICLLLALAALELPAAVQAQDAAPTAAPAAAPTASQNQPAKTGPIRKLRKKIRSMRPGVRLRKKLTGKNKNAATSGAAATTPAPAK